MHGLPPWQLTPCKRVALEALAHDLEDAAGVVTEDIEEYLRSDGEGWDTPLQFLAALERDVWWHYGHVGEEEERHLFEATERRIDRAYKEVKRCKR